jgi:6-phosphogluconate dehydrogenase
MSAPQNDIGMVGLAVMGRNLVLNMADHGFAVAAYNRTDSVTREFASELGSRQRVQACYSLEEFVASLKKPRKTMLMVKAGKPVDAVIGELEPLLEPGDVLVDGGNSYFRDTERREKSLAAKGLHFLGVGISGGEFGARNGPSMMPGGAESAYAAVRTIFEAVAARADGEPCVSYLGPGPTGHYVKMVHNGIEYGFMQLIAETYALMKVGLGLTDEELADLYAEWNGAELNSYLMEITSRIFRRLDEKTGGRLVDLIRGEAAQLGTGMWTSQSAMDLQVPAPNIDIAVAMRNLSALEDQRRAAAGPLAPGATPEEKTALPAEPVLPVETVRNALYAAMVITYSQGFAHLQAASKALDFGLRLEEVAAVWRGGCIIRSALLRDIKAAFHRQPELPNLLIDPALSQVVVARRDDLVRAVTVGASAGIAVPGLMTALGYLDAYRADWLPFNLIQAQRDYFGAHTYQRLDEEGIFHTDWLAGQGGAD